MTLIVQRSFKSLYKYNSGFKGEIVLYCFKGPHYSGISEYYGFSSKNGMAARKYTHIDHSVRIAAV